MKRAEDIIDYRGRLRSKPINKVSRRQKGKLAWRKKRKAELMREARQFGGWPTCPFSGHTMYTGIDLCHAVPVGMRGDGDTDENTFLGCHKGNLAQGSMRFEDYMKLPYEVRRRNCGFRGESA